MGQQVHEQPQPDEAHFEVHAVLAIESLQYHVKCQRLLRSIMSLGSMSLGSK